MWRWSQPSLTSTHTRGIISVHSEVHYLTLVVVHITPSFFCSNVYIIAPSGLVLWHASLGPASYIHMMPGFCSSCLRLQLRTQPKNDQHSWTPAMMWETGMRFPVLLSACCDLQPFLECTSRLHFVLLHYLSSVCLSLFCCFAFHLLFPSVYLDNIQYSYWWTVFSQCLL